MIDDRRDQVGDEDRSRLEGADLNFEHSVTWAPGGGQRWTVWCDVDGQVVRAEASTPTQAWDLALKSALQVRRSGDAGGG